ncbi:response regulator [Propionivibrio dicarboxylicus]|uniref:Two-component system, chemotaxis family, response regulator CheY n=1 Tax=Propionivibrio dicarboxylicus TaxID=83767 RepID=A0A1G8ERE2_9RHOO|nr:response regulator [Propionivibrio dicarboxylicus]SDH72299.1 two-component system, chemotaxis family, response regulator CheY [Propionivibrio dicarboxylicus]
MPNVLVVDDSETVRTQLRNDLTEQGYQIFEAGNGVDALKFLIQWEQPIDLIFCDINMPEMDGLSLCRELHKDQSLARIPIFMLTTQTNSEMKQLGKENGVIAWIVKPYEKKKVMNGVAKVLGIA